MRSSLEAKINAQATELETTKKQAVSYKTQYGDMLSQFNRQSGDLTLMTSRWQSTLKSAKQLPIHQTWIKNLQQKYQQTLNERNDFENLACQYVDMHADANQKVKRLNKRVTDQESYKYRLDDMMGKVHSLNDKVTASENHTRGLYGMITQIQNKWRQDRSNSGPELMNQLSSTKADLYALQNKSQTEISELQQLRNKDLAEQNSRNQDELEKLKKARH